MLVSRILFVPFCQSCAGSHHACIGRFVRQANITYDGFKCTNEFHNTYNKHICLRSTVIVLKPITTQPGTDNGYQSYCLGQRWENMLFAKILQSRGGEDWAWRTQYILCSLFLIRTTSTRASVHTPTTTTNVLPGGWWANRCANDLQREIPK